MGGRKGAVAPTVVVDVVLLYKDEEVVTNSNGEKSKYKLLFKYSLFIFYV